MQGDFFFHGEGEGMRICRNGEDWGEITVNEQGQNVQFHAVGQLPKYGEILRVWGLRKDAQPLLIGVAEPHENNLVIDRKMSKQYLSSLGYWPQLPETYAVGVHSPEIQQMSIQDPLIIQAKQNEQVQVYREQGRYILSCPFDKNTAFPLAFISCFCTVKDGRAQLIWDTKKGCPVWTAP